MRRARSVDDADARLRRIMWRDSACGLPCGRADAGEVSRIFESIRKVIRTFHVGVVYTHDNVAGQDSRSVGRSILFDFEDQKPLANRANGHSQPERIDGPRQEALHRCAGDGKTYATIDHRIDPDDAAARVSQRTARVAGCKPHACLYPIAASQTSNWSDRMHDSEAQGTHKAERIANGQHNLAWRSGCIS